MDLTNHIFWNVIGSFFRHLPRVGEVNDSRVKVIKYYQLIRLINSNQRIKLIKSNQIIGLIESNQDMKFLHMAICSIITYGMTINRERQDTQ